MLVGGGFIRKKLLNAFIRSNGDNGSGNDEPIRFRSRMLAVMLIFLFIVLVLLLFSFFLFIHSRFVKLWVIWALYLLVVFILAVTSCFFITKVFTPLARIEAAIKLLENGGSEELPKSDGKNLSPLMISLNNMLSKLKDYTEREYTAQILKKQAEINALQSQINPHFLYNTLEALRGQALIEGVEQIANMTEALSTFFRYSISQKGNIVTLADELRNVDNYLIIQQYRFNNKFNIIKKLDDEDTNIMEYRLPKLTIQPIIENAIFHGLETKIGKGNITIKAYTTEKRLVIIVTDDGVGMVKAKLDKLNESLTSGILYSPDNTNTRQSGIALINVNERIRLYFGNKYGITVSSTQGFGTSVEIVLPANIDDNMLLERNYET